MNISVEIALYCDSTLLSLDSNISGHRNNNAKNMSA